MISGFQGTSVKRANEKKEESSPKEQSRGAKSNQLSSVISTLYNDRITVEKGFSLCGTVELKSKKFALSNTQLNLRINLYNSTESTNDSTSELQSSSNDIEGDFYKALMKARQQKYIGNQILYLEKLSDFYLSKGEYIKAAHLLNGALSLELTQKGNSQSKQFIKKLTLIEEKFIEFKGFQANTQLKTRIKRHHESLLTLRLQCITELNEIKNSSLDLEGFRSEEFRKVSIDLTEGFKTLLKTLIEEAQTILGKPPVEWACIGMGSMARNEMCPYSDVEFGFVLAKDTHEALKYFRNLSEILELQFINFRETRFSVFERVDKDHPSATPSGFSLDTGGNTPLGVKGVYELIGTPQQLAKFVGSQWIERNQILSNAMSAVCWVAGERKLVESYNVEKNKLLDTVENTQTNREVLAFKLLDGHIKEFAPDLTLEKERIKTFGIKKELYRPFQEILGCLSLVNKLRENNTFNRINELLSLHIFSKKGAKDLQDALANVLFLRIKAHFFYQGEKEYLCHPIAGEERDNHLLYVSIDDRYLLETIYSVLINFHNCAKDFFKSKNKHAFNKEMLGELSSIAARRQHDLPTNFATDTSGCTKARYLISKDELAKYDNNVLKLMEKIESQKATEYEDYQKAVSLNPTDWISLMRLAKKEQEQKKTDDALQHYLNAYKYVPHNVPHAAFICKQIGDIYTIIDKKELALAYYEDALAIQEPLVKTYQTVVRSVTQSDIFHLTHDLFFIYFEMGNVQLSLDRNIEAIDSFNEALKLIPSIHGSIEFHVDPDDMNHLKIWCTDLLGRAHLGLKDYPNAIKFTEIALEGYKSEGCKRFVGNATKQLARIYRNQGQTNNALKYYSESLKTDDSDKNKADVNCEIANMYFSMAKFIDALKYAEQYSKLKLKIYGNNSIEASRVYTFLGTINHRLCKYQKAFEQLKKALEIIQKNFDEKNVTDLMYVSILIVYSLLALGQPAEALAFFRKSLNPSKKIMEQLDQIATAPLFDLTALLHFELGKYKEALEYYVQALETRREYLKEDNEDIVDSYISLAETFCRLGQYEDGLDMQQKALTFNLKEYGENYPLVAKCYDKMGLIYFHQKDTKTALKFHQQALNIRSKIYGSHHPYVAECYENIGHVYCDQEDFSKAREAFKSAFFIIYKAHKQEHPILASCINKLIAIGMNSSLDKKKNYDFKFFKDFYTPCKEIFGKDDRRTKLIETWCALK